MFDPLFFVLCFGLGVVFEFISSSLGGGYGTVLTPLFMFLGYSPLEIVPIILLSETITGLSAGFLHNHYGNTYKRVSVVLAVCAVLGSIAGVSVAVTIPPWALEVYIGLLIMAMGLLMVRKHLKGVISGFSWPRVIGIGSLCGFNKAMSGGGFEPLATTGLNLSGVNPKRSVGSMTLAKGLMSMTAVIMYGIIFKGLNWNIAIPLITGAFLSTIPASYTTNKLPEKKIGLIASIFICMLGVVTLVKLVL